MATVRKTITLTDTQNDWVKAQIDGGDYTNDSELFRDLIRKAQQERAGIEAIRSALIEGEKSGMSDRMPGEIRQSVKNRKLKNGPLSI